MAWHLIYPGECSMYLKSVFSALAGWLFCRCHLGQVDWQCHLSLLHSCWFSVLLSIHYWEWVLKLCLLNCPLLPLSLSALLHAFWSCFSVLTYSLSRSLNSELLEGKELDRSCSQWVMMPSTPLVLSKYLMTEWWQGQSFQQSYHFLSQKYFLSTSYVLGTGNLMEEWQGEVPAQQESTVWERDGHGKKQY